MARLSVDVPDSVLGEEKAKELKSLKTKVVRLETKTRDLERQLKERDRERIAYNNLRSFLQDNFDLYPPEWE
jgi:predicted RNase H-like nuclease (RuvC/YqgF family)